MEQKYGEKFEYVAPWGNSMTGTHELLVGCDSFPGRDILVQIENYRQEDKIFSDNYLAVKYYGDTVDFFENCASRVFGEAKVFYDVSKQGLSPDLPANATFREYLADTNGFMSLYIAVRESSFLSKEQVREVTDTLLADCKAGYLGLILVGVGDSEYETLDDAWLREQIVSRDFAYCARITRENGSVRTEWLGKE
jgi:hypothetical protein